MVSPGAARFAGARWTLEGDFNDTVCFLSQQAAKKALKSVLYYDGARRQALTSHSLFDMLQRLGNSLQVTDELMEAGRSLDLHYIASRYPNGLPAGAPHAFYGKTTAEKALGDADLLFAVVSAYYADKGEENWTRGEWDDDEGQS